MRIKWDTLKEKAIVAAGVCGPYAFESGNPADNFTVLLLRLIAKADSTNREKLAKGYPNEVIAVEIYQNDCPYLDKARTDVDWEKIEQRAEKE